MDYFWEAFALWSLTRALGGLGYVMVMAGIAASGRGTVRNPELTWASLGIQLIINLGVVLALAEVLEAIYG